MLILGRRAGESIVLDGGITIVVLACERGGVRLGIQAPPDVTILRGEIVQRVQDENRRAPADPATARACLEALGRPAAAEDAAAGRRGGGAAEEHPGPPQPRRPAAPYAFLGSGAPANRAYRPSSVPTATSSGKSRRCTARGTTSIANSLR